MDRACYVTDEAGTWPGTVLSWIKQPDGWHAVVRYRRPDESGYSLQYERWASAATLAPRP